MIPFEEANAEAYRLLLRIEVTLREPIRAKMAVRHGLAWQKRLPGKLLEKIRAAQKDEELRRQFGFLALGPLYYLTFGELLEVLRSRVAEEAAVAIGGPAVVQTLETLTSPRNAVGHARSVSPEGLATIRAAYQQLQRALTPAVMESLLGEPDCGFYPGEARGLLRDWVEKCLRVVESLDRPCPDSEVYRRASSQYWWGASELAPFDCDLIAKAASVLAAYDALPGGLGSKAERLHFVQQHNVKELLHAAVGALKDVS